MRPLFKNDIIRVAKDFNAIRCWGVYFLIYNDAVIYVGYSAQPLSRLFSHKNRFEIHKYHVLYFKTREEAIQMEKEYIRTFKPIYNIADNDESPTIIERRERNKIDSEKKVRLLAEKLKNIENEKLAKILAKDTYQANRLADKEAKEKALAMAEMQTIKANINLNIPNDSYIKKTDIYYFRVSGDIFEIKKGNPYFFFKGRKYKYPDKVFGKLNDLQMPQD